MDLSINLEKLEKKSNLILKSIPKNQNFFFYLNCLIRNLQKICKIPKPKHKTQILKKLKTQTQT